MCRICETLWTISGVCCLCYLMLQPHLMLDAAHRGHHPQPPKAVPHDLSPLEAMLTTTEALAKARGWPSRAARDALARGLETRNGRPRPRRFEKGEGPLCAVLMWTATFVLEIAKFRVFEPFVAELDAQVPSINMSALVDWTELGQAHTLLHVFAEHPSQVLRGGAVSTIPDGDATRTLGERVYRNVGRVRAAERAKRKLKRQETKAFCDTLNRSAAAGVCYGRDDEPRLGWMKISGFAIGTDGTMLALFDDVEGNIAELRAALRHAADPMFPAGAVRQTAPLHLVIGRFVDWPVLNDTDRARVNLCVERWAAALREHREPQDGTEVPYIGATARLYELELARDDAFGFFERTTHRRVPLLEGYPEEYSDDESVRRKAKKAKKEKKKEF
jgi:hypothetical protein